jgi:hypothetical protein
VELHSPYARFRHHRQHFHQRLVPEDSDRENPFGYPCGQIPGRRGIDVTAVGNLINKNSAKTNTTNYRIVADNRYGPIVDLTAAGTAAVNGNSAAGTTVNADPQANFAY